MRLDIILPAICKCEPLSSFNFHWWENIKGVKSCGIDNHIKIMAIIFTNNAVFCDGFDRTVYQFHMIFVDWRGVDKQNPLHPTE